jgi:hypothetical protein
VASLALELIPVYLLSNILALEASRYIKTKHGRKVCSIVVHMLWSCLLLLKLCANCQVASGIHAVLRACKRLYAVICGLAGINFPSRELHTCAANDISTHGKLYTVKPLYNVPLYTVHLFITLHRGLFV